MSNDQTTDDKNEKTDKPTRHDAIQEWN